ncbi:MAG: hypothetical protein ACE5JS_21210, partial [Nitrospinota bacterium]
APHAIRADSFFFVSGLYATDLDSGIPVASGSRFAFAGKKDVELHTECILGNPQKNLQAAGTEPDQVVKTEVFLAEPALLPWVEEV